MSEIGREPPPNGRRFYKMVGSGNDFVFVDGREHGLEDWSPARIQSICQRRTGVGADGVVHLAVIDRELVRMVYWNADGSRAEMCGNAALCAARLVVWLGLADSSMVIEADSGRYPARTVGEGWEAEIRFPPTAAPRAIDLPLQPGETQMFFGTVGVPHAVILVDDITSVSPTIRGRTLRFDPAFGSPGANVNFLSRASTAGGDWRIRTYERGVEDETLACGTGTVAAALTLVSAKIVDLPVRIQSASGSVYTVLEDEGGSNGTWLRGPGQLVFVGELG